MTITGPITETVPYNQPGNEPNTYALQADGKGPTVYTVTSTDYHETTCTAWVDKATPFVGPRKRGIGSKRRRQLRRIANRSRKRNRN